MSLWFKGRRTRQREALLAAQLNDLKALKSAQGNVAPARLMSNALLSDLKRAGDAVNASDAPGRQEAKRA